MLWSLIFKRKFLKILCTDTAFTAEVRNIIRLTAVSGGAAELGCQGLYPQGYSGRASVQCRIQECCNCKSTPPSVFIPWSLIN
jgi:hypothetical protein